MEGLLQPTHLFFILLIVLIIFGPGKLPDLGRSLGKGIREFKDAMKGTMEDNRNTPARPQVEPPKLEERAVSQAQKSETEKTVEHEAEVKVE